MSDVFFPKIEFRAASVSVAATSRWLGGQGAKQQQQQLPSEHTLHHISITLPSSAAILISAQLPRCISQFISCLELLFQPRHRCPGLAEVQTPQTPALCHTSLTEGWIFYHFPIFSHGFYSLCIYFQQHSDWVLEVPAQPWLLQVLMHVFDMTRCDTLDLCENNLLSLPKKKEKSALKSSFPLHFIQFYILQEYGANCLSVLSAAVIF